jgi:hypothetical protein
VCIRSLFPQALGSLFHSTLGRDDNIEVSVPGWFQKATTQVMNDIHQYPGELNLLQLGKILVLRSVLADQLSESIVPNVVIAATSSSKETVSKTEGYQVRNNAASFPVTVRCTQWYLHVKFGGTSNNCFGRILALLF